MTRLPYVRFALPLALAAAAAALPATPAAAQQCTANCLAPGDYDITITPDLVPRSFKLHVPASYDGRAAVPLLVDLHGFSSDADEERSVSGQLQQSDKRGFIAAWPDGLAKSWNAYGCCSTSRAANVPDVKFVRAVITYIQARARITADRVYVTGISNGGGLAQRVACEASDVVHAVASVSFPLNRDACTPARPITVYEIAGTADTTIPYDGAYQNLPIKDAAGVPVNIQSAPQSLAAWGRIDRCSAAVTSRVLLKNVQEDAYGSCDSGTRAGLLTIVGGRHVLYNGYKKLGYDGNNAPIDVSEYIWNEVFRD